MLKINRYGDYEEYCDECGGEVTEDVEIYDVDTDEEKQTLCIFCLRTKFKRKATD